MPPNCYCGSLARGTYPQLILSWPNGNGGRSEDQASRLGAQELCEPLPRFPEQGRLTAEEKIHRLLGQKLPQGGDPLEHRPGQGAEGAGVEVADI